MRGALAGSIFAIVYISASIALAGSFEAGLAKESDFDRWVCGDVTPSPSPNGYSCRTAHFGDCAECDSIVVTNTSAANISAQIEISGEGFRDDSGNIGGLSGCPEQDRNEPAAMLHCYNVGSGRRCFEPFEFCPSHAGESKGQIKITVQGPHGPETQTIPIVAKAVYSSAIQSAESVLDSYRAELMKLPHIKRVSIDKDRDAISIKVEVEDESHDDVAIPTNISRTCSG
jgi:hypothetical protein